MVPPATSVTSSPVAPGTTTHRRVRSRLAATAVIGGAVAALTAALLVASSGADAMSTHARVHRWSTRAEFAHGTADGTRAHNGALSIVKAAGSTSYSGTKYDRASWTSPWSSTGFAANQLIASWNARTPKGTLVAIALQGRTTAGQVGSWDNIAHWAEGDGTIKRESGTSQGDDYSHVETDTVVTNGSARYRAWKVRVTLLRKVGTSRTPSVRSIGAVASQARSGAPSTSRTTVDKPVELKVPSYSQEIHTGEYPQWDNGGEAWCSPTSTTMVLRYFHSGPSKADYGWVNDSYRDPFVDNAARQTFDYRYDGTGNWPFNTAYASTFTAPRSKGAQLDAFVTRLKSLRDAEKLVKAGIPVIASLSFGPGELSGSPISSTNGHVMVIAGFTRHGNVIAADPAAPDNSSVRRVYDRGQFERAWQRGSDGTAYVIHPNDVPLPRGKGSSRW